MNQISDKLSNVTKNHYEDLIGRIGDSYIEYRWKRNPISFSHYEQTLRAVEFAFSFVDSPVQNVLEIGSGPGTWTDLCLRHSKSMTIVDISSEMIKLARDRYADMDIDFYCGDFLSDDIVLPQSYDVIFSGRAVEYMDNKEEMIAKSVRNLEIGGYLFIITKNPNWMDKKRDSRKARQKEKKKSIHEDWISWHAMEAYYRKHGLKEVRTYPVCLGSYKRPLNNRVGVRVCNLMQKRIYKRKISSRFEFLVESYMSIGRKI